MEEILRSRVERVVAHPVRCDRPRVHGKFIYRGDSPLYIRGVTYGPFRPDPDGIMYHTPAVVERDFTAMVARGINAVRTYTVPPRWFLDLAHAHGLLVMVGLPIERQTAFLDSRKQVDATMAWVRTAVRSCAGHPALLCYVIGNEIPARIVRWHGHRRVERFLRRLYDVAKAEDPATLVTYVNYPSTEYLHLPFIDFVSFNVYLESEDRLQAYLGRLHTIAGDRPLVMSEIGLDSLRHGGEAQARSLAWQIPTAFAAGCAGLFVFAWTDEWFAGGIDVDDWAFGLTTVDRQPKPALSAVETAFAAVPFPAGMPWPRISVVISSYNGARTLPDCFEALRRLSYPNYEVIVVDDGSTDATTEVARAYGYRVISTVNRGLSNARNTGMEAATGEIVAYLDDDAYPDPHWLHYLASTFLSTEYVAVGGPNIGPHGDGWVAACVDNSPGNPVHILLTDHEADHLPGCNLAIRKSNLLAIGGFDPQFRVAGDDVDVCWRLQARGWKLGYSPAAMVWHHRRNSVRAYWKQQFGYGRAEALLERKWPQKYNRAGHLTWTGHVYGKGHTHVRPWADRIYHGSWGSAPFQQRYLPAPSLLWSLPLVPEWYLILGVLAALATLGVLWSPMLIVLPVLILGVSASLLHATLGALQASFPRRPRSRRTLLKWRLTTGMLHLLHPLVRLRGRLYYGLTPWRASVSGLALPRRRTSTIWSNRWQSAEARLYTLEHSLRAAGALVRHGGECDTADLIVRGGMLGATRLTLAIEDHEAGAQLVRVRSRPEWAIAGSVLTLLFAVLAGLAAQDGAFAAAGVLGLIGLLLMLRMFFELSATTAVVQHALDKNAHSPEAAARPVARVELEHDTA